MASEEWLSNTLNHINGGDRTSITDIMDPLLLVDEDHPRGSVGGGHHRQDVPERQAVAPPLGVLCAARPREPVARGAPGLLPFQLGVAAAVELVAVTWTPWRWTGGTHGGRTVAEARHCACSHSREPWRWMSCRCWRWRLTRTTLFYEKGGVLHSFPPRDITPS